MADFDNTLARMQELMNYKSPVNESKRTGVEYSAEGADGKRYGIIKEGTKFYVKCSDKDAPNIAESYNYIGGIMAKNENAYNSYNNATKHLELKLMSLNEAYNGNTKVSTVDFDRNEKAFAKLTEAARADLNRMNRILENSMNIGKSNVGAPEAPKTANFKADLGTPFEDAAKAELDKDMKKTASEPKAQGEPFDKEKCAKADMQSDKAPKCDGECDCSEPAKYVPNGAVAAKKPAGGKVVRVNEDANVEPTADDDLLGFEEEDVDENGDVVPSDFDDEISDESLAIAFDLDAEPAKKEGSVNDLPVEQGFSPEVAENAPVEDDEVVENCSKEMTVEGKTSLKNIVESVCKGLKKEIAESKTQNSNKINEKIEKNLERIIKEEITKLNVFGKHPGYRKKPMTVPANNASLKKGTKDWDDASVKGDQPFGQKIGDSFPFDQAVELLTDKVMDSMKNGLKKK